LNKEQLIKAKELLDEALKIDPAHREKFLDEKCGSDVELKKEILSLISSLKIKKDFLEEPLTIDENSKDSLIDPYIGKQIGNYLIDGEAGVGGMGVVYSGTRNDKEFEHKVAIKILKYGISSEYLSSRFQIERQTLANLQHEYIANLLDGGRTDEGLPYLVMEFIDGIPVTEYCNQNNLNIDQRLELFQKVCSAVQYAHQNLVIHRDIKPGNILVNKSGTPKLLDFGIAKLIDEDLSENAEGLTKTGIWHLTPEYSSPEQIRGEKITTVSDIYSLGVLLYEILTGEQPYRITSSSPVAISKIIAEENVLKPSEKVKQTTELKTSEKNRINLIQNPEKISRQLQGDLDNIVLKVMHKDQGQRYSSVQEFKDDIDRYLKGLPVTARRDTITYRASKFVRRHKAGFAIFVIVNLIIIVSVAAIIYQGNIAATERDNAKTELKKFEEVNNFLLDMLSSPDPSVDGKDVKVYDLLEKATKDADIKLKNYPKIKAAIKQTLGSTFIGLGEYKKAEALLLESLESDKKLFGINSEETAKCFHQLGLCYDWIGNYQLADSFYKAGINTYEKISDEPLKGLADNLNDFGSFLTNAGYYDSTIVMLKRALDIYAIYDEEKGQKEAVTINNLAVVMHNQNKVDEAEKYYLEARDILTNLYGVKRPEIATIYNNLAFIYLDNKKYEQSEEAFQKAYEIKVALLGKNHPNVGLAFTNLGMLYCIEEKYNEAEIPLHNAINLFLRTGATKDPLLAFAHYWLGRVYLESNQLTKSETEFRNSLRIREEIFPKDDHRIWSVKGELGVCLFKQKKNSEAEKLLTESLNFYLTGHTPDMKKITRYTEYSAKFYKETGDTAKEKYYESELKKLTEESPEN